MAGCVGNIGYVYISGSQISLANDSKWITRNGESYQLDTSGKLLKEYGLPDVGATVTLSSRAYLLPYAALSDDAVRTEARKWAYVYDDKSNYAYLYQYNFGSAGNLMRSGAKIKILSYMGDAQGGHSQLYALVSVVSD